MKPSFGLLLTTKLVIIMLSFYNFFKEYEKLDALKGVGGPNKSKVLIHFCAPKTLELLCGNRVGGCSQNPKDLRHYFPQSRVNFGILGGNKGWAEPNQKVLQMFQKKHFKKNASKV